MKIIILLGLILASNAHSSIKSCESFELSLEFKALSRVYFLRTMTAKMEVKGSKATLLWDSGHESKKWKVDRDQGLISIRSKDLKKVFESYVDSTSAARYVQLMNFIEDYEDEDDFRFTPLNEAAPFLGDNSFPAYVGEYLVSFKYSDCE
ncbi:MAG: hypothetical protein ACJAT2_002891 [Bacteriovoracaceae bacterium]|jgi:hypothetical protein